MKNKTFKKYAKFLAYEQRIKYKSIKRICKTFRDEVKTKQKFEKGLTKLILNTKILEKIPKEKFDKMFKDYLKEMNLLEIVYH